MNLLEFIVEYGKERDHHQVTMKRLHDEAFRTWMDDYQNDTPIEPRIIALKNAGLLAEDGFYIWGYTGSCSSWLNCDKRNGQEYCTDGKRHFAIGLEIALGKLAAFEGISWRWEEADEEHRKLNWFKEHIGLTIRMPYFLSTSLDNITSQPMLWRIKTIAGGRGRYIGPISNAPSEQEVLFLPDAKFKIIGVDDKAYTVFMEELPFDSVTQFDLCGAYDHSPDDIDPDMLELGMFDE